MSSKISKNRKRLFWVFGLMVVNILLGYWFVPPLDFKDSLFLYFLNIPLFSIFMGVIFALFPNKKLPYQEKFKIIFSYTSLIFNGFIGIALIIVVILTFLGFYPTSADAIDEKYRIFTSQEDITESENEVNIVCDSINYYMDNLLNQKYSSQEIETQIRPKYHNLARRLNARKEQIQQSFEKSSEDFEKIAQLNISCKNCIEEILRKHKKLKEQGIELRK